MWVRTRPSMVEGKDDNAVMYENSETGFRSLRTVKGVTGWYISAIPTCRKDSDNLLLNIQSTFRSIYGYLLTFSTWRLRLNFIPICYRLVLYWSQRGYFSIEVQSCTLFFSSISRITHHSVYFIIPSTFVEASRWSGGEQDNTLESGEPAR